MIERGLINSEELTSKEIETVSLEEKVKNKLHANNNFFFLTVCDGTSANYFEAVIEGTTQIPPRKQHSGLVAKEEPLFQLAIGFCEYFSERFLARGEGLFKICY